MRTVDFIYGLASRYSYLASTQIARLEAESCVTVRWRPLQSARLLALRRDNPFDPAAGSMGQYDWGYRRRDAEDWAAFYGVPYNEPVGRMERPDPGPLLALAAFAAERQDAVVAMSHRLFRLHFVDDRTRYGRDEVIAEAAAQGLDVGRFVADLDDPGLVEAHDQAIGRVAAQGVFGVPTFLLDGRMFWGNDRIALLQAAIRGEI